MKPSPRTPFCEAGTFAPKLRSYFRTLSRLSRGFAPSHFRTLRSSARFTETEQSRAAFSLTEVVIAMGVAAVAFTSIIALFPLGLNMSKESYEETQAALLARTILADLKDEQTGAAATSANTAGNMIQKGPKNSPLTFTSDNNYEIVTTDDYTIYIAYKQSTQDDTPTPQGESVLRPFRSSTNSSDFYDKGIPEARVITKIQIQNCFSITNTGDGPHRVDVTIESPGTVPTDKRKQFVFTGAVGE